MSEAVSYVVRGGTLSRDLRRVLAPFSLSLRRHTLTAIVGHGGAGKSSLLRALAGLPSGGSVGGEWTYRGEPLAAAEHWGFSERQCLERTAAPGARVVFLEQLRRPVPLPGVDRGWRLLREELGASRASAWLLDEPTAGAPECFAADLRELLLQERRRRDIVLVTHDQSLVRAVADSICLLGEGMLEHHDAQQLFAAPSTPLTTTYLRTGSSWVCSPPAMPELPSHFHWVLPDQVAGMGRPGLNRDEEEDLSALSAANVNVLVSLTEAPFPAAQLRAFGIEGKHFAVPDMGFPAIGPTARLCRFVETRVKDGERVAFHCHAGLGRTGTLLAAYLIWMRQDARQAIEQVRAVNPRFIQTVEQERFLERFQEDVG